MMDREKAKHIDAFKYWCETNEENGVITIPKFLCDHIIEILDDTNARPHGEWLFVNHVDGEVEGVRMVDMLCECTVCHYRKLFPTRSYGVCVETKPYCENCGAYMRKEGEEE